MMAMAAATADGKPSASASRNAEKMRAVLLHRAAARTAGDQRTEISHRADAEKDDGWIDRVLYALIEDPRAYRDWNRQPARSADR